MINSATTLVPNTLPFGKVKKDTKFTNKNLIVKRPGDGISPIYFDKILNKYAKINLEDDHKIKFKDIKSKI